jgi:hypothetical protein
MEEILIAVAGLIVALAGLISSIVVPFLSVIAAQRLVRQDSKRQAVGDVLIKARRSAQDFRHAFLNHYYNRFVNPDPAKAAESHRDLRDLVAELDGVCFQLGLTFDKQADPLGRELAALAKSAALIDKPQPPGTWDDCHKRMNGYLETICREMKPLWDSVQHVSLLPLGRKQKTLDAPAAPSDPG